MPDKNKNPEEILQKFKNNPLSEDDLEKVSGGGLYVSVDPGKCPKHVSKYVIYADRRFASDSCTGCEHVKEFGNLVRCEFAYTGNYEWEW